MAHTTEKGKFVSDKLVRRRMAVALFGALLASASVKALTPTERLSYRLGKLDLENDVPKQFGDWSIEPRQVMSVVNPQQEVLLKELYSQILARTYRHKDGYRVMLAIAYGGDQRETLHAHYPEACYPAQGFKLRGEQVGQIDVAGGSVPVRRLDTALGHTRQEPVTYWVMVGEQAVLGGYKKKLVDLHYTMRGLIPDGLLFRVSSVDPDTQRAYARQEEFIKDLLAATRPEPRRRLAGL